MGSVHELLGSFMPSRELEPSVFRLLVSDAPSDVHGIPAKEAVWLLLRPLRFFGKICAITVTSEESLSLTGGISSVGFGFLSGRFRSTPGHVMASGASG